MRHVRRLGGRDGTGRRAYALLNDAVVRGHDNDPAAGDLIVKLPGDAGQSYGGILKLAEASGRHREFFLTEAGGLQGFLIQRPYRRDKFLNR